MRLIKSGIAIELVASIHAAIPLRSQGTNTTNLNLVKPNEWMIIEGIRCPDGSCDCENSYEFKNNRIHRKPSAIAQPNVEYYETGKRANYDDAVKICEDLGMEIAEARTESESEGLFEPGYRKGAFWLGVRKGINSNNYFWNSDKFQAFSGVGDLKFWYYENDGVPDAECVGLERKKDSWLEIPCDFVLDVVCQKRFCHAFKPIKADSVLMSEARACPGGGCNCQGRPDALPNVEFLRPLPSVPDNLKKVNRHDARDLCMDFVGLPLAEPKTLAESKALQLAGTETGFYIGAKRRYGANFSWELDEELITDAPWYPGHPDDDDDCVVVGAADTGYRWKSYDCDREDINTLCEQRRC